MYSRRMESWYNNNKYKDFIINLEMQSVFTYDCEIVHKLWFVLCCSTFETLSNLIQYVLLRFYTLFLFVTYVSYASLIDSAVDI